MRALLFFTILSSSAFAELPQLAVSGGWSTQVFSARQVDLVATRDDVPLGRIAASAGIVLGVGIVDLELAFASGSTAGLAHQNVYGELVLTSLQAGVAYRLPIFPWLQPYVQLSGGTDWATLTLGSSARLTQTVLTGSGALLGGVQFAIRLGPARKRMPSLVFDFGAGGVLRPAVAFDAMGPRAPTQAPAEAPIAVSTVNVGSMPMSGFTARIQLGIRY
jgi:hypothetical protein